MKRLMILAACALISFEVPAVVRKWSIDSDLGPATATSNVTLAAPGRRKSNCLTDVVVISSNSYTFRILDGGTTTFALAMQANTGLTKDWPIEEPFCSGQNATMEIKTDAGSMNINYKGFVMDGN